MVELDEDAKTFMGAVLRATNAGGANQLAGLLVTDGRLSYGEGRKIAKWARGEHFPDGKSTLMLLDVAGFLTEEARQLLGLAARSAQDEAEAVSRAQDILADVERLAQERSEPRQGTG